MYARWLLACQCFLFDDAKQFYCCSLFLHSSFSFSFSVHFNFLLFLWPNNHFLFQTRILLAFLRNNFVCVCALVCTVFALAYIVNSIQTKWFFSFKFLPLFISFHFPLVLCNENIFRNLSEKPAWRTILNHQNQTMSNHARTESV